MILPANSRTKFSKAVTDGMREDRSMLEGQRYHYDLDGRRDCVELFVCSEIEELSFAHRKPFAETSNSILSSDR